MIIVYLKKIIFLKKVNICGCDLCTVNLDYPRYIYLKKDKNTKKG